MTAPAPSGDGRAGASPRILRDMRVFAEKHGAYPDELEEYDEAIAALLAARREEALLRDERDTLADLANCLCNALINGDDAEVARICAELSPLANGVVAGWSIESIRAALAATPEEK